MKSGRAFLLAPFSLTSIEPLIFRKQTADDTTNLGDKGRDHEVATGH
jgi:hypothetical protein